jgi:hypothetical protein
VEGNRMITREKLIHHVEHLKEKHDDLDRRIQEMYERRIEDFKVEDLKKQKLKLRDEIEQTNRKINDIK